MSDLSHQINARFSAIGVWAFVIALLSGCATPQIRLIDPPVYPPLPAETRYVYEGSIRSGNNITVSTFSDRLREFVTGIQVSPLGLAKPYSLVVKNERIYVSDTQQRAILVFDLQQRTVSSFGMEGKGSLLKPLDLAISKEDEIYVVDISAKRVAVYDLQGDYLRAIGSADDFQRPVGIACHPSKPWVYVVDAGGLESDKHQILIFDRQSGALIRKFGTRGREPGQFNLPLQASMSEDARLYVVDSANFRVQVFDENGEFVSTFGQLGRRSGQFSRPKGIATDKNGNAYIVDTAFGNFQIFTPQGELLLYIGARATSGGPGMFSLPSGIDVDEQGRIYVVDQFFRKIDIFRPVEIPPRKVFSSQVRQ
ncbi:MAG: 6-bladed beta-propeller [Gammaproteobacteria bacterium]|nr:6-bladed beta-propeller [Gammaproteobacteria bacterium]